MASRWILSCILLSCVGIGLPIFGREYVPLWRRLHEEKNSIQKYDGGSKYGEGHGKGHSVDHSIYNDLLRYLHREFVKRLGGTRDNRVYGILRYRCYPGDRHDHKGGDRRYVHGTYRGGANHRSTVVD